MSIIELKRKIEETNKELCTLIAIHNYNLQKHLIIECSQKLDELIVAYMHALS